MAGRREKLQARFDAAVTPALEPGETAVAVVPALGGPNPWAWAWLFLAGVIPVVIALLFFVPAYVLAVTDRRVLVLRGSRWRAGTAKELLFTAPRSAVAVSKRNLSRGSAMVLRLGYIYVKLRFPDGKERRFNVSGYFSPEVGTACDALAAGIPPVAPHAAV